MPDAIQSYAHLGALSVCQAVRLVRQRNKASIAEPIPDAWALPGRRTATTAELTEIATRNGWPLTLPVGV